MKYRNNKTKPTSEIRNNVQNTKFPKTIKLLIIAGHRVAVRTVRVYNTRGRGDLLPNNIILRISSSGDGRQSGATSTADGADGHAASGPTAKHVRFPAAKRTRTAVVAANSRGSHRARGPPGQRSPRIVDRPIGCAKRPRATTALCTGAAARTVYKAGRAPTVRSCLKLMSKENLQALVTLGFDSTICYL